VKAYTYQNGTVRAPLAALEADEGPYRLRRTQDAAAWPPKDRAYGGELDGLWERMALPLLVTARLVLPVLLLSTLLGAAYLYTDALLLLSAAPAMVQKALPAISDLIVPMTWYSIHLTNRRLGAPYAFGQLMAGMALIVLIALINPWNIDTWINATPALSARALAAFCVAFLLANFAAITFFEGARGPRWWSAPLAASFVASLVFCVVYYPAAFAGGQQVAWADSALVHFALFFGESILLLGPYYLLRPAMRPIAGLNGY
jgi:uncharacterized PurR-regulated membrane protein YhhQ (DUF165 family)